MNKKIIINLHAGFWGMVLLTISIFLITQASSPDFFKILQEYFTKLIFRVIVFYSFYFSVSKFTGSNTGIISFSLYGLLFLAASSIVFDYLLYNFLIYLNGNIYFPGYYKFLYLQLLSIHFIYAVIGLLLKITIQWFYKSQKRAELEKQNISNKITLLKAQVNPHFLFNTLNNINSFIHYDPGKASFSINKLKLIMNYLLNDSDSDSVTLCRDVDAIRNYIELQKPRYANPDFIEFNIDGNLNGISVPPLLFLPFIENAFKHGLNISKGSGIIINLILKRESIYFSTLNYVSDRNGKSGDRGGFGLKNIKRRLDLIFKNNYELNINSTSENYLVKLKFHIQENYLAAGINE